MHSRDGGGGAYLFMQKGKSFKILLSPGSGAYPRRIKGTTMAAFEIFQ